MIVSKKNNLAFVSLQMSVEDKSMKIKKKKKQGKKKTLPKNVFEVVGENGKIVERVDSNKKNEEKPKKKQKEDKQVFSERTQKRRVNLVSSTNRIEYSIIVFHRNANGI